MNRNAIEINIDEIKENESLRENKGDLSDLERSIKQIGLLHPLVIDRNKVLVSGSRRLEACRNVGLSSVTAIVLKDEFNSMTALDIQTDENLCRKPLSTRDLEKHINLKKNAADKKNRGVFSRVKKIISRS